MLIPLSVFKISQVAARAVLTRYAAEVVRIERAGGRPFAVATDGRRLVYATWAEPASADGLPGPNTPRAEFAAVVHRRDWDAVAVAARSLRTRGGVHAFVDEHGEDGQLSFAVPTGEGPRCFTSACPELPYPDWRKVVPAYEPLASPPPPAQAVTVRVHPKLLAGLLSALADVTGCGHVDVHIPLQTDRVLVIEARGGSGVHATGLLVPMTGLPPAAGGPPRAEPPPQRDPDWEDTWNDD